MKYKIVIYGFTLMRDVGSSLVLKNLLELKGSKVVIASSSNIDKVMQYWKPDALIINTVAKIKKYKSYFKKVKIIYLAGEGGEPEQSHDARYLSTGYVLDDKRKDYKGEYENIDQMLLWGEYDLKLFKKYFPNDIKEKIIVGNPRLDLTKYRPKKIKKENNTIGFISRFNMINSFNRKPLASVLGFKGNLERSQLQSKQFCSFWKIFQHIIDKTDYNISYRAYTLEAVDIIENIFKKEFGNRIIVDSSIVFAEWVQKQSVIITPASTSFFEPYILKIPIINIDKIIGDEVVFQSRKMFPYASFSYDVGYNPETNQELYNLIDSSQSLIAKENEKINNFLNYVHNYDVESSALENSANSIIDFLKKDKPIFSIRLPLVLIKIMNWLLFKRAISSNNSLKYFIYNEFFHKIPPYCREVISNIKKGKAT